MKAFAWMVLVLAGLLPANVILSSQPATPASGALPGSPGFKPTPERPVGWRGDWTGRFPGATPPIEWSRRVKGITSQLKYQADRPSGRSADNARPLEYFTIKDWLVAGPFSVDDPVKDIDKDFLGGEAKVLPAESAAAGNTAWKFLRADVDTQSHHEHNSGTCGNSNVDFVYAFGKITDGPKPKIEGDFANKVAYAHTYVHSPSDAKVQLQMPFSGKVGRFWLNGKSTDLDPKNRSKTFDVALSQGWNRLLVKVGTDNGIGSSPDAAWQSKWLVAAYLTPILPVSYETRNVAWMTKMTGRSMSQPIIVGDRIFVGSGISDLLCIDKKSGKVLWMRSNTPYDTLTAGQRADIPGMKEKIEPLVAKLDTLNEELVVAINAAVSPAGLASTQQAALDAKIKAKTAAERDVHNAFEAVDRRKYSALYRNEISSANATPVSDGRHVYWACGGSQWSAGAYLLACFDLDGKRAWTRMDTSLGAAEHGNHVSPALVDGKLIYSAHETLIAYDAKTGQEVWRNETTETSKDWTNTPGQSVVTRIGDTNIIIAHKSLYLASDGTAIGRSYLDTMLSYAAPIVDSGVMYASARYRHNDQPASFIAVRLPPNAAPGAKASVLWDPDAKDVSTPLRGKGFQIASPLCVDGIVYSIDMTGGLTALDPAAGKCLYRLWLDGYNRYNRGVFGVCASPTLAGKYVYITDDAGYTHILQPGTKYKEIAGNVLENVHLSGQGGNPCKQESFYTSPYFEGKCMYLRGEEYLYCIGGD